MAQPDEAGVVDLRVEAESFDEALRRTREAIADDVSCAKHPNSDDGLLVHLTWEDVKAELVEVEEHAG